MKRHESLAPLSRQHQAALLLAQMLKKNAPAYKGLPTDTEGKILYAAEFYSSHLITHFTDEEKVFEKLKGLSILLDTAIKEIIADHVLLRKLFEGISNQQDPITYNDTLGHSLEKHIRKEERELFPIIEQLADETTLASIAQLLNH